MNSPIWVGNVVMSRGDLIVNSLGATVYVGLALMLFGLVGKAIIRRNRNKT